MKLLHMKIYELFWDTELDFFKFYVHKTGWGAKYPGQGIFTPTLYSWQTMWLVIRLKK